MESTALITTLYCGAGFAQTLSLRVLPPNVHYGTVTLHSLAQADIGNTNFQVSPTLRVYDERNLMVLGTHIMGQPKKVAYRLDSAGALQEIWLLNVNELVIWEEKKPKKSWFKVSM